jgi:hypothetical protein
MRPKVYCSTKGVNVFLQGNGRMYHLVASSDFGLC